MSLPKVVRLRNYRDYPVVNPESNIRVNYTEWRAPVDKVYVAVILGVENKDGTDPLPLVAMLRDLVVDGEPIVPTTTPEIPS